VIHIFKSSRFLEVSSNTAMLMESVEARICCPTCFGIIVLGLSLISTRDATLWELGQKFQTVLMKPIPQLLALSETTRNFHYSNMPRRK
jgi:hypothetical protein